MRRCDECGFDWDLSDADVIASIRASAERFPRPLSRFLAGEDPEVMLRTRPDLGVWSALEYAAHTRDVFIFYRERIERVLAEDRPQFTRFDFDRACEERGYNREDIADVARAVNAEATALAELVAGLGDTEWERIGIGSDGDERSVRVLAGRAAHDGSHHLLDIGRGLRAVRQLLG